MELVPAPEAAVMPDWVGKLVEIVSMTEQIQPEPSAEENGSLDVNGQKGRVVEWLEDVGKYAVSTFSGLMLFVKEENLEEFEPLDAEDGGFDLVWPQNSSMASGIFGSMLADCLETNSYCVIQMFLGDEGCQQAIEWSRFIAGYHLMTEDFQEHYLGRESDCKTAWLGTGALTMMGMDDVVHDISAEVSALELCDQAITTSANYLHPYSQQFSADSSPFQCWGRTNVLVRSSFSSDEEKVQLKQDQMSLLEEEQIDEHYNYMDMKRLCFMYLIDSEGGTLTLHAGHGDVIIPLTRHQNQLVVFRDDQMEYTYSPVGDHLALQAWILEEPMSMKLKEDDLRVITGPPEPEGARVNVMCLTGRYPGSVNDGDHFYNMVQAGTDAQLYIPLTRWDPDIYYRSEHTIGYSMTCHGGFMGDDVLQNFDNKFFGVTPDEANRMAPKDRLVCEVGYETLHRGGFRRETLNGLHMGVFLGDSGSDWTEMINYLVFEDRWNYQLNAVTCSRLSWTFGLTGPCSTAETACSSSLVGMGIAHMSMRDLLPDQPKTGFSTGAKCGQNLCVGVNTLIGPGGYIGLSGPGMLTHAGRCFTFDMSADGYARGEGIGGLIFKKCNNEVESMGRLAMLIGSCVAQDGRSASMTAPHGPSQQEVIRACMQEAGLDASMVTIAECHGTGTALGDPIEIGSLRGTMKAGRGEASLLCTSTKSNIGHLEAGAGMAGVIKCIVMLRSSCGTPNCHLVAFNPHLDIQGFPLLMETEHADFGHNSGLTGVSSFGFGGTNARADLWGHCTAGPRACVTGTSLRPRSYYT